MLGTCTCAALMLLQAATQNNDSLIARGVKLYNEAKYEDASRLFEQALTLDGRSARAHLWLGRTAMSQVASASFVRKPILGSRAKGHFRDAVTLEPGNLDMREALVDFLLKAPSIGGGGTDKARVEALEAKRIDPYRGSLLLGRVEEAAGNAIAAENEYRALVAAHPDSSAPIAALSSMYQARRQWKEAFEIIDQRLKAKPSDYPMMYQLGRAAALSGQRAADGESALRAYLARPQSGSSSNDAPAHWRLGMILEARGDRNGAVAEYTVAARLDPRNEDVAGRLRRLSSK